MSYRKNFATKIAELRRDNNMSMQVLATTLGVTHQAISLMEHSKRSPSFEILCQLADFFDVSLDYLCGRSESRERLP
ncbi:MAG: helix-turn-helix domain-containing protein [Clostridiales bacterium]|jgi:transcriptional regulator with XRE-family HTH domain|nr:helix-turn-helix domain-containing protein [Clostridiales bacterium]